MFYDPAKTQYFKEILLTIIGQALVSAQYSLMDDPLSQQRGLYRFRQIMPTWGEHGEAWISWQLLAFQQSPIARFRIELQRIHSPADATRLLADVVVNHFQADILPTADFWWEFRTGDELPHAIAHAGKVLFAYGLPWLELRED